MHENGGGSPSHSAKVLMQNITPEIPEEPAKGAYVTVAGRMILILASLDELRAALLLGKPVRQTKWAIRLGPANATIDC
jgi:hypothetical protein